MQLNPEGNKAECIISEVEQDSIPDPTLFWLLSMT